MGNIINKCKKTKDTYTESLLESLNTEDENNIIFNDLVIIKNQIKILESTTQSSIKNIATDMTHFNTRYEEVIKRLENLEAFYLKCQEESIYHEPESFVT